MGGIVVAIIVWLIRKAISPPTLTQQIDSSTPPEKKTLESIELKEIANKSETSDGHSKYPMGTRFKL